VSLILLRILHLPIEGALCRFRSDLRRCAVPDGHGTTNIVLDGFTIQGGNADGSNATQQQGIGRGSNATQQQGIGRGSNATQQQGIGGGLLITNSGEEGSNLAVSNCHFSDNRAVVGGGSSTKQDVPTAHANVMSDS
jgi:hypothetical protein